GRTPQGGASVRLARGRRGDRGGVPADVAGARTEAVRRGGTDGAVMSPRTAARTSGPDIEILVDPLVQEHRAATVSALELAGPALEKVAAWGRRLAEKLSTGGRLLVCGNGGSAAE